MLSNNLLKNCFYGNEIEKLDFGSKKTFHLLEIKDIAISFFKKKYEGIFGGPITLGDAIFIASMMYIIKPNKMVEFGVASGFSSAFIVYCAEQLGLLKNNSAFLFSYDIVSKTPDGNKIGQLFFRYYPDLTKYWKLHTQTTSADLLSNKIFFKELYPNDTILAFVDAEHAHPWPLMDLIYLRESLKEGSWIIFQDIRMMERWLMDTIKYSVPCPPPIRGVELVFNYYPGTKLIGVDLCYNIGALRIDKIDSYIFSEYLDLLLKYPPEINGFDHIVNLIKSFTSC